MVSSNSLYDGTVIRPGLMDRVLVEGGLLPKDDSADAWFMDLLLGWLGEHNSHIVTPPLPEAAPAEFCAGVANVLETARQFRRSDGRYLEAARLMVDAALGPLYPVPASKPAGR